LSGIAYSTAESFDKPHSGQLVSEVSANFFADRGCHVVSVKVKKNLGNCNDTISAYKIK
jgi:hypothetical protein